MQTRKLKEEHYIAYMEALHNLAVDNNGAECINKYVFARDKLFLVASEDVIKIMLKYEENAFGIECSQHDTYLTELIKTIRKDLKIRDKDFPEIYLKK